MPTSSADVGNPTIRALLVCYYFPMRVLQQTFDSHRQAHSQGRQSISPSTPSTPSKLDSSPLMASKHLEASEASTPA